MWIGATVTSLLFTIGRFLIGLYIGKSGVASGFGAAGSLIVVFIWVFYSAQIFLIGAEFTWVYATTVGSMRQLPAKLEDKRRPSCPTPLLQVRRRQHRHQRCDRARSRHAQRR